MNTVTTVHSSNSGGILVVDDNDMNRDICAINLEGLDLPLHFAANGEDGLEIAKAVQPDLILLDIMMPVMDGFEMLRIVRQTEVLSDIPVLMLTAKAETDSVVQALELGANDYLKKPFAEEEMVARVKTLLRNRYLERQVKQDLADGAAIQAKFLTDSVATTSLFTEAGISIGIYNEPYRTVSGDFFYTFSSHDKICFFLGDSSGHGLSAALISMRIIGFLQRLGKYPYSPSQFLKMLNRDICGLLPSGNFVAGSCISFSEKGCSLSNAAQPYVMVQKDTEFEELAIDGFPLGINESANYLETEFLLQQGERVILFTDGILEISNPDEELYGKERLKSCLASKIAKSDCKNAAKAVADDIAIFRDGAEPDDDLTLIVLEKR